MTTLGKASLRRTGKYATLPAMTGSDRWRVVGIAVVGMFAGAGVASWLAPKVIAWYFDPPAQFGISCREPIEWALKRLQTAQAVGSLVGAVASVLIFLWARKRLQSRVDAHLPPHYPPPGAR